MTVTLNRPSKRNALNSALMYALWDAVAAAGEDAGVDGLIVTGRDPACCARIELAAGLVNHVVPHEELLPLARRLAADIAGNDQRAVRRLLVHYRQIANAATLDEAHLVEGMMAETWKWAPREVAARRAGVTARGR